MIRAVVAALAVSVVALAWPIQNAHACSCMAPELSRDLANAKVAFVGKASSRTPPAKNDGKLVTGNVQYQFELVRGLKGAPSNPVVVSTAGNGAMCGTSFEIGKTYIVFAYADGTRMSTGLCSGNMPATPENLAKLDAAMGAGGAPPPPDPNAPPPPDPNAPPPPDPNAPPTGPNASPSGEPAGQPLTPSPQKSGCAGCAAGSSSGAGWLVLLGLVGLCGTRRRRRPTPR